MESRSLARMETVSAATVMERVPSSTSCLRSVEINAARGVEEPANVRLARVRVAYRSEIA